MGRTVINVSAVLNATTQITSAKNNASSAKNSFAQTKSGIDSKIQNRANIRSRLSSVHNQLSGIDGKIGRIRSMVQSGANRYQNTDTNVNSWGKQIKGINNTRTASGVSRWASYFDSGTTEILKELRDRFVQFTNGHVIYNENLICEYLKKNLSELSDEVQALILETISQLKDTVVVHESLLSVGTEQFGVDIFDHVSEISESKEFDTYSALSVYYNDIYVRVLEFIIEQAEDENTFAASLVKLGIGGSALSLLGVESSENIKEIFGTDSLKAYVAKYKSEHAEEYLGKLEVSETDGLKSSGKFKEWNKAIKDELEDRGKYKEFKEEEKYYDKDGNEIEKKDAPDFYERQVTLAEAKHSEGASVSIYDGSFNIGEKGKASIIVGEAEAYGSISGGFYVVGANGEKKFSPGVKAEVGASVTALEVNWEQQWLGDENWGLNTDLKVTAGKASAKAEVGAQVFGEDGKLDVQLGASASAEIIGGEIEGTAGVNVLGGEVGVSGSINYGLGAHADVGYKDGVFKCDIGASLGVGVSLGFEVDVGGMVDTVAETASEAWDCIKSGWDDLWDSW